MKQLTIIAVFGFAFLTGCEKDESKTTLQKAASTTQPATTGPTTNSTDKTTAGAATKPSTVHPTTGPSIGQSTGTSVQTPTSGAPVANTAASVKDAVKATDTKEAAADLVKNASTKIGEVSKLVSDGKIADAEASLNKLEQVKSSLPEAVQSQLGEARKALNTAKSLKGELKPADLTNLNK